MPDTATTSVPPKPATLDDLMIAMDVVDTVRHREDLVRRELGESGREAELIQRLKEIYRQQGIDVPDHVLAEGVKALKESRFTYNPPPPGWKRTLFTAWATRQRWGRPVGVIAALLLAGLAFHYFSVTRPAQLAQQALQLEIRETLPKAIRQAHADIRAVASEPAPRLTADQLLVEGERAIRDRDRAAMARIESELKDLRQQLVSEYTLTIVSRPGETSGVSRRPPGGSQARNYYLIVEPIAPDGRKLKVPVRDEELSRTVTVDQFAVRVPQSTFDAVAADKRDDGIIQKNRFGVKRRGTLALDYDMPFEGGMITRW